MRLHWTAVLTLPWNIPLLRATALPEKEQVPFTTTEPSTVKRIAIVGGGTGGVTTLKSLLVDLPSETTHNWEVVLFEQRRDVGGVWLPDFEPPNPPQLPETPLYPRLKTNTPHPTMTIPNFPFRPLTELYPHHPYVQQYHADIITHWNLTSHLRLHHEVLESRWIGSSERGHWRLSVLDRLHNSTIQADFDHLIVASGHNHYPYEPHFDGRDVWLQKSSERRIFHSIFYRTPEDYAGKNVLVVGGGASGRDIAQQIVAYANSTTVSLKSKGFTDFPFPDIPDALFKPRTARFTASSVVFSDDTELNYIDTVILATGYDYRIPFLTAGGHLDELSTSITLNKTHPDAIAASTTDHLVTNRRYIRPLFSHVLSLDTTYPLGSLYFIGLPIFVANAICDTAAALFTAYTIANSSLLNSREEFLQDLIEQEKAISRVGDPWYIGHRQLTPSGPDPQANQDKLVAYLQERDIGQENGREGHKGGDDSIIPPKGEKFTKEWRTLGRGQGDVLKKGWERVKEGGKETVAMWLAGVETEEEWADMMRRLIRWEKEKEREEVSVVG